MQEERDKNVPNLASIEVRPHRGGWQAFEAPGVEPYYRTGPENGKQYATDYAIDRLMFRPTGEVHVVNAAGEVERVITHAEALAIRKAAPPY